MAEPTPDLAAIVARGDRIVTIPEGAAFHGGFSEDVTVAVRAALEQRAELERALRECHQQMEQAVVLCDRGRPTMAAAILRACLRGPAGPALLARSAAAKEEKA